MRRSCNNIRQVDDFPRDGPAWPTNAEVDTSSRIGAVGDNDSDEHKERLAAALGIDLSSRMLPIESPDNLSRRQSRPRLNVRHSQEKSFWSGTKWFKEGPLKSKWGLHDEEESLAP